MKNLEEPARQWFIKKDTSDESIFQDESIDISVVFWILFTSWHYNQRYFSIENKNIEFRRCVQPLTKLIDFAIYHGEAEFTLCSIFAIAYWVSTLLEYLMNAFIK